MRRPVCYAGGVSGDDDDDTPTPPQGIRSRRLVTASDEVTRDRSRVLRLTLAANQSLDVVHDQDADMFSIVLAEHGPIARRTLARITRAMAFRLARFLAGVEDKTPPPRGDERTDPGP